MDMFFIAVIIVAYLVYRYFIEEEKTKQKKISEDAHTARMQMMIELNSVIQQQQKAMADALTKQDKTNES